MAYDQKTGMQGAMTGAATGAMVGSVVPGIGTAIGAGVGLLAGGAMGFMGGSGGPNYSNADAMYTLRRQEIGDFANQLAGARGKYLTALGKMYDNAYSRFSGNAEAGFAARGLAVNGGAFASALARKSADFQFQGDLEAANMERMDDTTIAKMYGDAAVMNQNARSGGAVAGFNAERDDSRAMGGFVSNIASYAMKRRMDGGGYNAYSDPNSRVPDYRSMSGELPENKLSLTGAV